MGCIFFAVFVICNSCICDLRLLYLGFVMFPTWRDGSCVGLQLHDELQLVCPGPTCKRGLVSGHLVRGPRGPSSPLLYCSKYLTTDVI